MIASNTTLYLFDNKTHYKNADIIISALKKQFYYHYK